MKDYKRIIATVLLICMLASICACGGGGDKKSDAPVGKWSTSESVSNIYPREFTINADGTGTGDGFSFTWEIKDAEITFNAGSEGTYIYNYSYDGETLKLDTHTYTKD